MKMSLPSPRNGITVVMQAGCIMWCKHGGKGSRLSEIWPLID